MIHLWPRLGNQDALRIWESISDKQPRDLSQASRTDHDHAIFTATGGVRISEGYLDDLRSAIKEIAVKYGFPDSAGQDGRRAFDAEAMVFMHSRIPIYPGEAAKFGMWSFLSLVLMPDIARWRFPDTSNADRFIGNAALRSVFQRLWWRAELLRVPEADDPYLLARSIREDAAVQLLERPGLAANRQLTLAIAKSLSALESSLPAGTPVEALWRDTIKSIRQEMPVVEYSTFDEQVVQSRISSIVEGLLGSPVGNARGWERKKSWLSGLSLNLGRNQGS